jgi:hypothetical protein
MVKTLEFSYNWNNKLNCKSFSTVRIKNLNKYVFLDEYQVVLKTKGTGADIQKGLARLQSIHYFHLHNVSPAISFLDSNLSVIDFQKLVLKMYKNKNIDFRKTELCFLVFQYLPIKEVEKKIAKEIEIEM